MPLQNRVDPFGNIVVTPQRGLFMGNRGGKIHDLLTKTLLKRRYASRRWIICTCIYKGWHREVMGNGYTELFFLDDVTALAAGHRPCALCRRDAFKEYRHFIGQNERSVDDMDRILHNQRLGEKPKYDDGFVGKLPDGTMIAIEGSAFAKRGTRALRWSFDGYCDAGAWSDLPAQNSQILTPALSMTALQNGFKPVWHPSASL